MKYLFLCLALLFTAPTVTACATMQPQVEQVQLNTERAALLAELGYQGFATVATAAAPSLTTAQRQRVAALESRLYGLLLQLRTGAATAQQVLDAIATASNELSTIRSTR